MTAVEPGRVSTEEESSSQDYLCPCDLRVLIEREGMLNEWWLDARRFQPFKPETE